jgi:hypothetical protein
VSSDVDPYLYPGTKVLRNRLGITDARRLDRFERRMVGWIEASKASHATDYSLMADVIRKAIVPDSKR